MEETTFYKAGRESYERGEKLKDSAIRLLRVGSDAWEEFATGYDDAKAARQKAGATK